MEEQLASYCNRKISSFDKTSVHSFKIKNANNLFDLLARNIDQGDKSPVPEPQTTDSNVMNFSPRRTSTPHRTSTTSPGPRDQPSYTNLDLMGNPLENGDHAPLPEDNVDPTKLERREKQQRGRGTEQTHMATRKGNSYNNTCYT